MRVATWNVNSVRARADRVVEWLDRADIDVLAMQEIKCKPDQFPMQLFADAGYDVAIHGFNQWNGVAIASRVGLDDVRPGFEGQPAFGKPGQPEVVEARSLGATCAGTDIWSIYVPNGRGLDDPHYAYKLQFLDRLSEAAAGWKDRPTAIMGDFNVAPTAGDIWCEADSEAVTHVTPAARAALAQLTEVGYTEVSKQFLPDDATYTFWDYKQLRFPKNEGMRIDFAFASPALSEKITGVTIMRNERKGKGASDHVPVVLEWGADS